LSIFDTKQNLMNVGSNIKRIRKDRGLQQKQIAIDLGIDQSNYNKIENGKREPSLDLLNRLAEMFNVSVNDILNPGNELPKEVTVEDKTMIEQALLIQQLDDEDKHVVFKMIETMLTKKKFKDFFQTNVATL